MAKVFMIIATLVTLISANDKVLLGDIFNIVSWDEKHFIMQLTKDKRFDDVEIFLSIIERKYDIEIVSNKQIITESAEKIDTVRTTITSDNPLVDTIKKLNKILK